MQNGLPIQDDFFLLNSTLTLTFKGVCLT